MVFGALRAPFLVHDFAAFRATSVLLSLCGRVLWLPTPMVGTLGGYVTLIRGQEPYRNPLVRFRRCFISRALHAVEHAYMHHVRVITSKKMACTSFIMTYIHATVAGKVLGAIEGCVCPLKQRSMLVNVGVNASQCSKKIVLCCFCMQKIRHIFFPYMELGVSIMSMGYIEHPKALI